MTATHFVPIAPPQSPQNRYTAHLGFVWIPLGILFLASACGEPAALTDSKHPTGSQAMALTTNGDAVLIAHPHEGTLGRVGLDGSLTELRIDGEPTRVTLAQGLYFVTLRQARSVAVIEVAANKSLREIKRIAVGAEPFGVVAPEDQAHVYVAVALEGVVKEIDAQTLRVTRTFKVVGEPRWLAWHPNGIVYALSAWNGVINAIRLEDGDVTQYMLPERKVAKPIPSEGTIELARRVTGDPAVTPDGKQLLVPALYLDTETPIIEPGSDVPEDSGSSGYRNEGSGPKRFQPVVVDIPVDSKGGLKLGDASVVAVSTQPEVPSPPGNRGINGYPTSVTVTADGMLMLLSIEGDAGVAALPTRLAGADDSWFELSRINSAAVVRSTTIMSTDAGPRAMVVLGDRGIAVFCFLDRSLQTFRSDALLIDDPADVRNSDSAMQQNRLPRASRLGVSTTVQLSDELELGRRLFYSANDTRMSARGSGVSCATCHFDGRTDGLSWTFERGKRQTPSLAGQVSLTEPVRWEGDRINVQEDARFTAGMMGGSLVSDSELQALAAFVDFTPRADSPMRNTDSDAVDRGKLLFERTDVSCSGCHYGAAYTDNQSYSMFGLPQVQTRSLLGVAASPPYLHDGSAPTLKDVLERSRDGSMGNTSMLTDSEMDDLEHYLMSL